MTAKVVTGGFLWGMKGIDIDDAPRTMTSEFRRQRTRIDPFGQADWHMTYEPDRVVIETQRGRNHRAAGQPARDIRRSRLGDAVDAAATRLLQRVRDVDLLQPAVSPRRTRRRDDRDPVDRGWTDRRCEDCASAFHRTIHTHSSEQSLYFDDNGLLRRQDYEVDVAGRGRAAHLISDYVDVQGLRFPTRRRVFMRNEDGTLQFDKSRSPSICLISNSAESGTTEKLQERTMTHSHVCVCPPTRERQRSEDQWPKRSIAIVAASWEPQS